MINLVMVRTTPPQRILKIGPRISALMLDWRILGKSALPVSVQSVWEEQVVALSARKKGRDHFLKLWNMADLSYFFDTIIEVHAFYIRLPPTTSKADVLFMEDFLRRIIKSAKAPLVSLEGLKQNSTIVITADKEYDDYSLRQSERPEREIRREKTLAEMEKRLS